MRNTLTSIAEHSDWLEEMPISMKDCWELHRKRVEFGKQPLEIWQFVPCKLVDGVWVVLDSKKPFQDNYHEYQEAKSRCIFEGWVLENTSKFTIWIEKDGLSICFTDRGKINVNSHNEKTIEDLVKYNLELTASAIKELGL